jgi:small-conductance mechanosensitive channel
MMLARATVTDSIRFWETGRLFYNLALLTAVGAVLALTRDYGAVFFELLPTFIFFAVIANVLYCAAYPVDLLAQASDFQLSWRKWRWALWVVGALFAVMLALAFVAGWTVFQFDLGPGDCVNCAAPQQIM